MAVEITHDGAFPELFSEYVEYKRNLGYVYPESRLYLVRRLSRFPGRSACRRAGVAPWPTGCCRRYLPVSRRTWQERLMLGGTRTVAVFSKYAAVGAMIGARTTRRSCEIAHCGRTPRCDEGSRTAR